MTNGEILNELVTLYNGLDSNRTYQKTYTANEGMRDARKAIRLLDEWIAENEEMEKAKGTCLNELRQAIQTGEDFYNKKPNILGGWGSVTTTQDALELFIHTAKENTS